MISRRRFMAALVASGCSVPLITRSSANEPVALGLVADTQYADADPAIGRYYRQALRKLEEAVEKFNSEPLDACVNLGDLVDRDWESYGKPLAAMERCRHRFYHVLGNHDFAVAEDMKWRVPEKLGMRRRYYAFRIRGCRFVVLDTNEVSIYAYPRSSPNQARGEAELRRLASQGAQNAQSWNGAVGAGQLAWFEKTCRAAARAKERAVVFAHHPVFPPDKHNAWNAEALVAAVLKHKVVAAWVNGHNHAGNFGVRDEVPFVTLKGMVDNADQSAFAIARVHMDRIQLVGYGREPSRELMFRQL